jgi:hypothetical protein
MTVVLRALGLQAAYAVLQTFSPRAARAASLLLLLTANAMPLVALLSGRWAAGDVLIAYWLENIVIGTWTLVKLATTAGPDAVTGQPGDAPGLLETGRVSVLPDGSRVQYPGIAARVAMSAFFTVHYGMFTLGHGVFTFILVRSTGTTGSFADFALMLLVLFASHGLSTGIHWFARRERTQFGLGRTMAQPYGRILVMHTAVLGGGYLVSEGRVSDLGLLWPGLAIVGPGLLLIAVKVVADVAAHLYQHRGASRRRVVVQVA